MNLWIYSFFQNDFAVWSFTHSLPSFQAKRRTFQTCILIGSILLCPPKRDNLFTIIGPLFGRLIPYTPTLVYYHFTIPRRIKAFCESFLNPAKTVIILCQSGWWNERVMAGRADSRLYGCWESSWANACTVPNEYREHVVLFSFLSRIVHTNPPARGEQTLIRLRHLSGTRRFIRLHLSMSINWTWTDNKHARYKKNAA